MTTTPTTVRTEPAGYRPGPGTINAEMRAAWLRLTAEQAEADMQRLVAVLAQARARREAP